MIKRLFDIVASGCALILLAPVIAVVAWQVRCRLGSPVLFRQVRPGLKGKPFEMIKFRTMRDAVDEAGNPLPDSERMTPFGSFLRFSSLDELPELWNVLKGDMSLVGPRPLLMEYLPLYSPEQYRRHELRPGITGWAQINGRNALSWEDKFKLDVWYVDNQSFWLDLKIIFLTVKKVLARDGINAEGCVTAHAFRGSDMSYKIYDSAKIINREKLSIGNNSQIDDFVFLNAGEKAVIGDFVHIASFCSVIGGGEFYMDDFSGLSAGCRVVTGSDDFSGGGMTNPTVPPDYTNVRKSKVHIGRHAIIGTNVTILPGVTIGEGAAVGAGAVVRKDLEPWTIYAGFDCRPIKKRPSEKILALEKQLLEELSAKISE